MHQEHGGVILSGLGRTVAWLAVFCVLAFDAGGIVTNRVLLDEAARVAAAHAAEAFVSATTQRALPATALQRGRAAAEASLTDQPGVVLVDVRLDAGRLVLELRRRARVLLAGRIPPLKDQVEAQATASHDLTP